MPKLRLLPHQTNAPRPKSHATSIIGIFLFACLGSVALPAIAQAATSDIIIADFEGADYGQWTHTGTAFGTQPAPGTLPNQMNVDGFQGHGLVNSFYGGDNATGTLTSPAFKIERPFLQFLIGGGGWADNTCMNLLIDGRIVRTATGSNTKPGGQEHLDTQQWDVRGWRGKSAVIQIVDQAGGTWGHINVDQIVQTDHRIAGLVLEKNVTRQFKAAMPYLNLPVKHGAPKRHLSVVVNDRVQSEFDIELAEGEPDWWAFFDLTPFKGQQVTLKADELPENSRGWKAIDQSREIKGTENLHLEALRPQFHFSSRRGWLNDPNGLVFYKGEYHLFYQHNPYGWDWGNMHWGHAVSRDLVHWKELPVALYPDAHGTMFSGSAIVDWNNTAGFRKGREDTLVAMFTAAGRPFTQGLAFSNDRGRRWTKYENNPVLPHIVGENRDPKVIWYAPEKKWVMALYLNQSNYALFSSPDLKRWKKLCDVVLPGDSECPEFFEIAVDENQNEKRWIFYGASGHYLIGKFDGTTFTPEAGPYELQKGNAWYASQTYNDIPKSDGRRILIPWGRENSLFRGMPFNQMMGLPVELTLRKTDDGLRLTANPVKELTSLRKQTHRIKPQVVHPGENPLKEITGDLFDITADINLGTATQISFDLRGVPVNYDTKRQELSCGDRKATLKSSHGKIQLRMLVDRTSIDLFANQGELYLPMGVVIPTENHSLSFSTEGGDATLNALDVFNLESAWR